MLFTVPPPSPPKVKAGLMSNGQVPKLSDACITSSMELHAMAFGTGKSIDSHISLNNALSSAISIAFKSDPINSTLYFSNTPSFANSVAMFSAV